VPDAPDDAAAAGEAGESLRSVLVALAANTTIATAKGVAALLTGSSALFAETLHTIADAGNEVLLYVAIRRSDKPADDVHPFGYGPERYFWALLAAVGMFVIGGAVSIWDGVHALLHPVALEAFWVGVVILMLSIVLDGISRVVAVRNLRAQAERRGLSVREMLAETADPTITTVYLEDTVDVLGAVVALVALILHRVTGSAVPDAIATLLIGALLGYVAYRLAKRNRELLSNQSVPARYVDAMRERLVGQPGLQSVERLDAVYLGPGDVLVAADVVLTEGLSTHEVAAQLEAIRAEVHRELPVVRRLSLTPVPEPDL
jgi:cation diffusion facilitator family transporter